MELLHRRKVPLHKLFYLSLRNWGRRSRGRDHIVADFKTTYAISVYHH
jgi:hypothetical protein